MAKNGLREEAEGVKDGCVKWVAQMCNPVVEWTLSSGRCLDSKPEECHHGETGMLDLCQLEGCLLLRVAGQVQWIERTTWVQPLFGFKFSIPLKFDVPDHQNLDPDQSGD
ncbi:hypothetical protein HanRHA438_Chr15g0683161 [Helianthus annuus]|nr:hypothetical protein HanRHA438_Chr15g0683161 [Helianthus annuus]